MKKFILLLLGLICILFATTALAQEAPEQARNFQINATHTGASNEKLKPPLVQKWVVDFREPISYPLIADGMVFVTVRAPIGTRLFALDAINGFTAWSRAVGGSGSWSAACYENGRVFTLNSDGELRAFHAQTGSLFWIRRLGRLSSSLFDAPPTVFEGVIYVSGDQNVFAVDAKSGSVLWTTGVLSDHPSSPAVTNEGVYVSDSCSNVYKFDPATGSFIWFFGQSCFGGGGRTPALYDGRLYVRDNLHDFFDMILDSQTGNPIGNFNAKNTPAFSGTRGFFLNGSKFFGTTGFLEARDVNTQEFLWGFEGDGFLQSALLVVNDYVYVGSATGNLFAVNAATGEQVWDRSLSDDSIPYVDEQNVSQPPTGFAAGEGLLVVPTSTRLIAFENDITPPTLTWGAMNPDQGFWNNTPVELPFTTEDSGTGVQSSNPESPLRFTTEGIGQTQEVTVTDNAGNTATFTSPEVNIDLTPPTTVAIIPSVSQNEEWFAGPVSVTLEASDNLSGAWGSLYILDGGFPQNYFGPITISGEGTHTLEYWSEDVAGNADEHKTRIVRIDSTAPATQASVSGTAGTNNWYLSAVQVSLSATDSFSGVLSSFYRINGGVAETYSGPFIISAPGTHTVEYWSIDKLNNREVTHSLVVKIDAVAPVVTAAANPATASKSPKPVTVTISGNVSDAQSGVTSFSFHVIDEYGATQPSGGGTLLADGNYSFTLTLPATRNGPDKDGHLYTIVVRAVDQAGNSGTATATLRIN